ncbi:hypothetical protein N7540_011087 [Penicillium herquei]|nr:hypothetical protein N7540_011087 [Penicillium herquei]
MSIHAKLQHLSSPIRSALVTYSLQSLMCNSREFLLMKSLSRYSAPLPCESPFPSLVALHPSHSSLAAQRILHSSDEPQSLSTAVSWLTRELSASSSASDSLDDPTSLERPAAIKATSIYDRPAENTRSSVRSTALMLDISEGTEGNGNPAMALTTSQVTSIPQRANIESEKASTGSSRLAQQSTSQSQVSTRPPYATQQSEWKGSSRDTKEENKALSTPDHVKSNAETTQATSQYQSVSTLTSVLLLNPTTGNPSTVDPPSAGTSRPRAMFDGTDMSTTISRQGVEVILISVLGGILAFTFLTLVHRWALSKLWKSTNRSSPEKTTFFVRKVPPITEVSRFSIETSAKS